MRMKKQPVIKHLLTRVTTRNSEKMSLQSIHLFLKQLIEMPCEKTLNYYYYLLADVGDIGFVIGGMFTGPPGIVLPETGARTPYAM